MQCSPGKREILADLIRETKQKWLKIVKAKEPCPTPDTYYPVSERFEIPRGSGKYCDLLGVMSQDIICASLKAAMQAGPEGPKRYKLQRDYVFSGSMGHMEPVRKPIYADIALGSNPEVVRIHATNRRATGIHIGSCLQYGREVFYGDDGGIYLVERKQWKKSAPISEGLKLYESDMMLFQDWRTFCQKTEMLC